jgi:assimilatory nitrate reductase catalytic subunit
MADGKWVRLATRRGSVVLRARITDSIRPETVFVPFHWGGTARANALTSPRLDPHSRMPEFKTCAVAVEPAPAPDATPAPDPPSTRRTGMHSTTRFLQGIYPFEGRGMDKVVSVPLRVVENLEDETTVELQLAAPEGLIGTVVVDLGLVEV